MNYEQEAKAISIDELPKFKTKDYYLSISKNKNAKVIVVAVKKTLYWMAYIGHPSFDDLKDDIKNNSLPNWMASHCTDRQGVIMYGDVLAEDIARKLFPNWAKEPYRTRKSEPEKVS